MLADLNRRNDYRHLDGLRAVAAFAILAFHYCPHGGPWLNALIASGPAAVGFFFLLSGFVLAQRHPQVPDQGRFWRARIVRIYPMYFLALLIYAPIAFQKYHHNPKILAISFFMNITMLQAWTNISQSWNGPSWSLSVEAFLYAIFPYLVGRIVNKPHILYWGVLAMAPAMLAIGFCNGWVPAALWTGWVENNPILGVPAFSFGIALGLFRPRFQSTGIRTDMRVAACLAGIVMMALLWPSQYREVFVAGGPILLLGTLIVLCTYPSPLMQAVLGNSLMVRLGKASYITYIMQAPLWHYYQAFANLISGRPLREISTDLSHFLVFVVFLLMSSVLLDQYIDQPVRAWLSGKRATLDSRVLMGTAA